MKTKEEIEALKDAMASWRAGCRSYFGPKWSKRKTNKRNEDGKGHLNPPFREDKKGNLHLIFR